MRRRVSVLIVFDREATKSVCVCVDLHTKGGRVRNGKGVALWSLRSSQWWDLISHHFKTFLGIVEEGFDGEAVLLQLDFVLFHKHLGGEILAELEACEKDLESF